MKKTYPHFSNKPYRKRPFGEPKDKWDHEGYDALMQESTRSEYSPQNYYFKKKKDEGYSYRKEVLYILHILNLTLPCRTRIFPGLCSKVNRRFWNAIRKKSRSHRRSRVGRRMKKTKKMTIRKTQHWTRNFPTSRQASRRRKSRRKRSWPLRCCTHTKGLKHKPRCSQYSKWTSFSLTKRNLWKFLRY